MKKFILLITIFCFGLSAQELFKDPQFKHKEKYWILKKKPEFSKVKPRFSRNLFTIQTPHSSESFYLSLITEVDVKPGETYELNISTLAQGEGELRFSLVSRPPLDLKAKKIKLNRFVPMGLTKNVSPQKTWQNHSYTFTAKELASKEHRPHISIQFGAFHGKVQIKDLHLTKL